jgi:nitroreductase
MRPARIAVRAGGKQVKVTEAVETRMSCRAFLPTPVPEATVRSILETARRSPSGGNLQPWHIHVLAGEPLAQLIAAVRGQLPQFPRGQGSEYDIYPKDLGEPYRSRRFKCGEDMYATIGVPREDRPARLRQFAQNYALFGAPVGLFFFIDRQMGRPQWADLGMYMQTVMLLAREHGLGGGGAPPPRPLPPPHRRNSCCSRAWRSGTATTRRPSTGCAPIAHRSGSLRSCRASDDRRRDF